MAETRARDLADLGVDATGLATDAELASGLASKPAATYSASAPGSPATGDIWYDTNSTPALAKFWDGSAWQVFSEGAAVISSPAATGSYSSGGVDYDYYTVTATTSFTVSKAGFIDFLLVAGGGGAAGGGGGGGGFQAVTNFYVGSGGLSVTVGAGGAPSTRGNPSRIYTVNAIGGGGMDSGGNDADGGSGAGGGGGGGAPAGRVLLPQGNVGAAPTDGTWGGGGGAGAAGSGNNGGNGLTNDYTGTSVTYAGGGGGTTGSVGGSGGSGGGGDGVVNTTPNNGTANTGGGGGGRWTGGLAGSGGSGVVVIRVRTN